MLTEKKKNCKESLDTSSNKVEILKRLTPYR